MRKDTIVFSINVQDIQDVSLAELNRKLNNNEISNVIDNLGNYFDWYASINNAILCTINEKNTTS